MLGNLQRVCAGGCHQEAGSSVWGLDKTDAPTG